MARTSLFFLVLVITSIGKAAGALSSEYQGSESGGNPYPSCGDCYCIPQDGDQSLCPAGIPQTVFPEREIDDFKLPVPESIWTLSCNPYTDASCETTPKQTYLDTPEAVCAFKNYTCASYEMRTFANRAEAEQSGARITHTGSCGLCSTAQDLAIYLKEDFTTTGKVCATKGLFNEQMGLECYMDIGLTHACATIWNYDGIFDGKACGKTCAGDITAPNNGPPPMCELSACLNCDEEKAGPNFSAFAGRTRRRSGLLSEIIRSCDDIATGIVHDPSC